MDLGESKRTRGMICLALVLAIVAVYWRAGGFAFLNYDDPDYVTENTMVKAGLTPAGIVWAFTHFHAGNWHPLTWISHMCDWQIFGSHAGGHHLVNLAFHAANAVLLFLLLQRLTGAQWRSALVAALFALHPLHVESVAWVAERKDVLSTCFGLLSLLAYARHVKEPKTQGPKSRVWHAYALGFFALSLLAKPMLVTLPFLMLLLDFWPLARVENVGARTFLTPPFLRLVLEKWPWFALAIGSSVVTFLAQKTGGAVQSMEYFPLGWRVANAITAYFDYVLKACWPVQLAVFYPLTHAQSAGRLALAAGFLLFASVAALITIRRRPFIFVGWLWFLGTLIPVIGLVQVGSQAMADRYTYLPLTGLFIIVVWGASEFLRGREMAEIAAAITAAGVLALLACLSVSQLQYWRNSLTLFNHALAITRDNAPANNNLGTALAAIGRREEALTHYAEAVRIDPNNARFQNNLATALARAGQPNPAVEHYQHAIQDDPRFAEAYSNLGALFLAQHRLDDAITNLDFSVRLDPNNGEARSNLGNALAAAGRLDGALKQYAEAVRLNPGDATIRLNAGLALLKAGKANDAMEQFGAAARLNPESPEAHFEFGRQLFFHGQFNAAIEQLGQAAQLRPTYAAADFYLSAAQEGAGQLDQAIATANQALALAQQSGQANLAARIQESLDLYQKARAAAQKPPANK
jgi:protein O-mannosyl-transferase